jgi:hypothetical protein
VASVVLRVRKHSEVTLEYLVWSHLCIDSRNTEREKLQLEWLETFQMKAQHET